MLRRVNVAARRPAADPGPHPVVVKNILGHQVLASRRAARLRMAPADVEFAADDRAGSVGLADSGSTSSGRPTTWSSGRRRCVPRRRTTATRSLRTPSSSTSVLALADVLVDIAESAHRDRPVLERGEALRASPVRAALNELAEQHPSLARARRVVRRLRRLR